MHTKLARIYRKGGLRAILSTFWRLLSPVSARMMPELKAHLVKGRGIEIGGPSSIFTERGLLPIYPLLERLDNCNFARETLWDEGREAGSRILYAKYQNSGVQYILEASDLAEIADGTYDYLISSHALEHCANPLKVLNEWSRVLTDSGFLLLILPHMEGTFDHRRPVTELSHMISDYELNVGEDDQTHFEEVERLHDLTRDPEAGDAKSFSARVKDNLQNRGIHHHVFDTETALAMVDFAGFQILAVESFLPFHIICFAQKPATLQGKSNEKFLDRSADWRAQSQFKMDREGLRF